MSKKKKFITLSNCKKEFKIMNKNEKMCSKIQKKINRENVLLKLFIFTYNQ